MSFFLNSFWFTPGGGSSDSLTCTVDHTKLGGSTHTDLTVYVVATDARLKSVANGGQLNSVNNVALFTDSGLTTLMKFERVKHDLTTGSIIYVGKIASASHTVDPVFYMQWDPARVTDQSDSANTWPSGVEIMQHLEDGTTLSLLDSTSNARHGQGYLASNGSTTTVPATTGKVGGGASFDATRYVTTPYNGTALTNATVAFWVNPTSNSGTTGFFEWHAETLGGGNSATPFILVQDNGGQLRYYADNGYRETSQTISTGTPYRVVVTLSVSGGTATWKFYLNGTLLSTYTGGTTNQSNALRINIGSGFAGTSQCVVDELEVLSTTWSADRVTADWNNQNDPSTFVTLS